MSFKVLNQAYTYFVTIIDSLNPGNCKEKMLECNHIAFYQNMRNRIAPELLT